MYKYFHIDGHRKDVKSPWIYQDGTEITFFRWANNEPGNGHGELCLCMETIPMAMHDAICRESFPFLCEINV